MTRKLASNLVPNSVRSLARNSVLVFASIFIANYAIATPANRCFGDEDIAQITIAQTSAPSGALLYVWSPRMVLSVVHADTVRAQAAALGLEFVALHDPALTGVDIDAALASPAVGSAARQALAASRSLCATTTLLSEATRHFPTAFVLRTGKTAGLHPQPMVGAMPAAYWAAGLRQRLAGPAGMQPTAWRAVAAEPASALSEMTVQPAGSVQPAPPTLVAANLLGVDDPKPRSSANPNPNPNPNPSPQSCIPANQFVPLEASRVGTVTDSYGKSAVALGSYERISPDGRFVLRSFSGGRLGDVSLIELSAQGAVVASYDTPLSNEAFPVQGSWRYVVDTNGDHYQFNSLLVNRSAGQRPVLPKFRAGMTGFYAAAAELPFDPAKDAPGQVRIRSLSWPNAAGSMDTQGEGALVARTVQIDTARHRVTGDSGLTRLCAQRVREDGPMYALPMLSVDGLEFAALPQTPVRGLPTMRVFGFGPEGDGCESRAAFAFSSGKTIFGFASGSVGAASKGGASGGASGSSGGADLAYEYQGQAWWVSRAGGVQAFNLAPILANPGSQLLASAFPGITRDGRIIYGASFKDCGPAPQPGSPQAAPQATPQVSPPACQERAGYVIADPYQSNAYQAFLQQLPAASPPGLRRQCITHADVARERAAFAKLHGLANP